MGNYNCDYMVGFGLQGWYTSTLEEAERLFHFEDQLCRVTDHVTLAAGRKWPPQIVVVALVKDVYCYYP